MNHLEKTFWDMQKNCISYIRDKETIWSNIDIIKEDVEVLEKNERDLSETVKAQSDNTPEGHVAQKKQEILLLAKLIYRLGRNLAHLAKKTNNKVLLQIVDISESALTSGEEKEIMLRFRAILDAARANLKELAKYSVTLVHIEALETHYKTLSTLPETISLVTGNRKSAKRSIKELNADARIILDELDDVFEGMILDEKFLEGWFDVRKIKGRHVNSKKANGNDTEGLPPVK